MGQHVSFKIARVNKLFMADITLVWFLSSMGQHVAFEMTRLSEFFIADVAFV